MEAQHTEPPRPLSGNLHNLGVLSELIGWARSAKGDLPLGPAWRSRIVELAARADEAVHEMIGEGRFLNGNAPRVSQEHILNEMTLSKTI